MSDRNNSEKTVGRYSGLSDGFTLNIKARKSPNFSKMAHSGKGVCLIQFGLSEEECSDIFKNATNEDNIQRSVSELNMYLKLIQNIPAILFVLFLGSWSDKNGRKIPMLLPLAGSFLSTMICMMNSYFWSFPPEHILMAAVPRAMTGGSVSLMMATYSYVSDISEIHSRTTRISMIDLMFIFSYPVGFYLSDVLYTNLGYTGVYAMSCGIFVVIILYVVMFIKETRGPLNIYCIDNGETSEILSNNRNAQNFFNVANVKDTMETCIKSRKNRSTILILMANVCLMNLIFGSISLDFLYVKKRFYWNYSQYVHLSFIQYLLIGVGSSIVLPLLSLKLRVEEFLLGALGCMSKISGSLIQAFAFKPWHLYLGCSLSCLEGIPLSVARSKISQLVSSEELGKTFSVLACCECIVPLLSNPLYTFTYNATLDYFPGTIYLITGGVHVFAELIFIFLLVESNIEKKNSNVQNCEIVKKLIAADDV